MESETAEALAPSQSNSHCQPAPPIARSLAGHIVPGIPNHNSIAGQNNENMKSSNSHNNVNNTGGSCRALLDDRERLGDKYKSAPSTSVVSSVFTNRHNHDSAGWRSVPDQNGLPNARGLPLPTLTSEIHTQMDHSLETNSHPTQLNDALQRPSEPQKRVAVPFPSPTASATTITRPLVHSSESIERITGPHPPEGSTNERSVVNALHQSTSTGIPECRRGDLYDGFVTARRTFSSPDVEYSLAAGLQPWMPKASWQLNQPSASVKTPSRLRSVFRFVYSLSCRVFTTGQTRGVSQSLDESDEDSDIFNDVEGSSVIRSDFGTAEDDMRLTFREQGQWEEFAIIE